MARVNRQEIARWIAKWHIGKRCLFGGKIKEDCKVVALLFERGFPMLKLLATTGNTYYCKYGARKNLREVPKESLFSRLSKIIKGGTKWRRR